MESNLTTVYLTDEQAQLFINFQKHNALIGFLESIDAFEIRNGEISIQFDSYGQIRKVCRKEYFVPEELST